ncbi:hypothetical protein [Lysobacter sp. TAB13]|uniref:hypothetical protein n=1 Tax=Lysobacter sp. TAB13 TaxID=3233065 RepID=UPI003F94AC67
MTPDPDRRRIVQLSLLAAFAGAIPAGVASAEANTGTAAADDPARAFDFFLGTWQVRYRRLKERLLDSHDWEEFEGVCKVQPMFGGLANMDESSVHRPGLPYQGMGLRSYDPASKTWADWWLDTRNPHKLDPPMLGGFADGVGTFFGKNTVRDQPVKVRGVWSKITATSLQWEQAFSPDEGKTWETNWVSRYKRVA